MRIGIRAHDVKADTFEGLVKEIHNEGMHCCQLAVPKAVHEFPTKKEVLTPGMALYMKEVFAENRVDVAVLGCYQNLATPDEAALKDTISSFKKSRWMYCMERSTTGSYAKRKIAKCTGNK